VLPTGKAAFGNYPRLADSLTNGRKNLRATREKGFAPSQNAGALYSFLLLTITFQPLSVVILNSSTSTSSQKSNQKHVISPKTSDFSFLFFFNWYHL